MGNISKVTLDGFKWVEETSQFNEDFIKNYNEYSDMGYYLEVDVQYPKEPNEFQNDLPFLSKRLKPGKVGKLLVNLCNEKDLHEFHKHLPFLLKIMKSEKVAKLLVNFCDEKEYDIHIRSLKQALNHELIFKKMYRAIKFNEKD